MWHDSWCSKNIFAPSRVRFNHDAISCTAPRKTFGRCVMIWVDVGVCGGRSPGIISRAHRARAKRQPIFFAECRRERDFPAHKSNLPCSARAISDALPPAQNTFCTFHLKTSARSGGAGRQCCAVFNNNLRDEFRPGRGQRWKYANIILPQNASFPAGANNIGGEWRYDSISVMESK